MPIAPVPACPEALVTRIREGVIGEGDAVEGPFGPRRLIYADYVASGRGLDFIEEAMRARVLPLYANTHTETSATGRETTRLREAARAAVRRAVGAEPRHAVIFAGAGATGAADRLVRGLAPGPDTVVFIGPYEHHSNDLPWRECGAQTERIALDAAGRICLDSLRAALARHAGAGLKIGAFSAASNVTGVTSDLRGLARVLHGAGAVFVCDFAAGGPYMPIDMAESAPGAADGIDAILLSPHKFVGGPGASGVLVADRALFRSACPGIAGGGTVSYVTETSHVFVRDIERREEAGTPDILGNIRAGMVLELKSAVGAGRIAALERAHVARLTAALDRLPEVEMLGPREAERFGVFALNIRAGARLLHHNFTVALLNDLFGIQARGGCSCAGPYGHALLGIGPERARAHAAQVAAGRALFRPGWVRLGVNYFQAEETVDALAEALRFIARRGAAFLPRYTVDAASGTWRARGEGPAAPASLSALWGAAPPALAAPDFAACLAEAERLADAPVTAAEAPALPAEAEALRWFWLPGERPGAGAAAA
ncbi:aminotransferase class V-fold PLP-dependent enzyme [Oceanicella sp. SM1341]|uniref:aminotransferase class V-fold PLP-dependent enzyme n=1 Tax=Oceanicella sp. SM1341 TaxID=1548889 RepID=UPI000E54347B|nr:aminotransferase class V-fold PLP-dependent enzyme [Oceanicella sp. SM1341]